jgi:hypothetical protein
MHQPNAKLQEAQMTEQMKGHNALMLEQARSQHKLLGDMVMHLAERSGPKTPLERATGLVERKNDQDGLLGNGPSVLAGA